MTGASLTLCENSQLGPKSDNFSQIKPIQGHSLISRTPTAHLFLLFRRSPGRSLSLFKIKNKQQLEPLTLNPKNSRPLFKDEKLALRPSFRHTHSLNHFKQLANNLIDLHRLPTTKFRLNLKSFPDYSKSSFSKSEVALFAQVVKILYYILLKSNKLSLLLV